MTDFKFVPAGRILSGAGTPYQTTYYNCYVIPSPKDSRGGIMENITMTVEIQARGGGVGVILVRLGPEAPELKRLMGHPPAQSIGLLFIQRRTTTLFSRAEAGAAP